MKNLAYDYLCQYKKAEIMLRQKEVELAELRARAEYRGQADGERVQTAACGDTLAAYVAQIIETERRLVGERRELLLLRAQIVADIQSLSNTVYVDLLYRRYIELKKISQIAAEMRYSPEYIRNHLHPAALRAMYRHLKAAK